MTPGIYVDRSPAAGTTRLVCASCWKNDGIHLPGVPFVILHPHALPLTAEEVEEIDPEFCCFACGEPLLEAGRVRKALEKLGFFFVTHGTLSAWMRPIRRPPSSLTTAVEYIFCAGNRWHAPLDDADGPVRVERATNWPEIREGGLTWVADAESYVVADGITALIAQIQSEELA